MDVHEKSTDKPSESPSTVQGHLTPGDYLAYLNEAISSYRSDLARPGWTIWALVGALATAIWLLFDQLEAAAYSVRNTIVLLQTISLLLDAVTYFVPLAATSITDPTRQGGFRQSNLSLSQSRPTMIILTIRWAASALVAILLARSVPYYVTASAIIAVLLYLSVSALLFALSFMRYPYPIAAPLQTHISRGISGLLLVIGLVAAAGYARLLIPPAGSLTVADLRLASIVVAIWYLAFLLSRSPPGNAIYEALLAARRDFASGRITQEDTVRQVDIALSGSRLSDILQPEVAAILALYSRYDARMKSVSDQLATLEALWVQSSGKLTPEQAIITDSLMKSAFADLSESYRIFKKIPKAFTPLTRRGTMAKLLAGTQDVPLEDVQERLLLALEHTKMQSREAGERLKSVVRTTEGEDALKRYEKEIGPLD